MENNVKNDVVDEDAREFLSDVFHGKCIPCQVTYCAKDGKPTYSNLLKLKLKKYVPKIGYK